MPLRSHLRVNLLATAGRRPTHSHASREFTKPLIRIPQADIYRFGEARKPLLRDVDLTVREGESWAVVGAGSSVDGKNALLDTLLGETRVVPPPPDGMYPSLDPARPVYEQISHVAFSHRPKAGGGAFYDYTARYGAVREEDRITLRESMFADTSASVPNDQFEDWITKLGLGGLLDLPLIALSNGQTRRARIVQALLHKPAILILDEPMTGLDVQMRPKLLDLLHALHASHSPRIVMGLRAHDPVPDWVTHLALVNEGRVHAGVKEEILEEAVKSVHAVPAISNEHTELPSELEQPGEAHIELTNLNVKYYERHVLKDINWTVRGGERWHLQGANGSGKTTLCSMLTGDHPQSYTQHGLVLFGAPRRKHATPALRTKIGVVSPELNNAWPRARMMSVREAVGTGFDGGFVPLGERGVGIGLNGALSPEEQAWREKRVEEMLHGLGPHRWSDDVSQSELGAWADRTFSSLGVGEQAVVLVMRALVGAPPVVLLDEVWSGMDERMVTAVRSFLRQGGVSRQQAVIVISHWENEVPWGNEDGVKRFKLEDGVGREL
ncbi:P-loop containing nucleoside triphosphate hydrolase protein [Peniophora sp. CONT]|nr:P-loop containing nucleoside triphosphate hydrolase protein [Peniophora sp. CONT]